MTATATKTAAAGKIDNPSHIHENAVPYVKAVKELMGVARDNVVSGFTAFEGAVDADNLQEAVNVQVDYLRNASQRSVEGVREFGVAVVEANKKAVQACFARFNDKNDPLAANPVTAWANEAYAQTVEAFDAFAPKR